MKTLAWLKKRSKQQPTRLSLMENLLKQKLSQIVMFLIFQPLTNQQTTKALKRLPHEKVFKTNLQPMKIRL